MRNYNKIVWLVFGLVAVTLFCAGLALRLDHDEAQFIASGYMIANQDLHPILDFVYYHQPLYSYIYALIFQFSSGSLLLVARVFCGLSVLFSLLLILNHLLRKVKGSNYTVWDKLVFPTGLLLSIGLTSGLLRGFTAWNHAFPSFLLLASYLILLKSNRHFIPQKILLAGFLFALAVALRASLAPMVLPLFGGLFFYSIAFSQRLKLAAYFVLGCLIGSIPVFSFMLLDFDAFYFNIIQFHTDFDEQYLFDQGRASELPERLALAWKYLMGTNNLYLILSIILISILFFVKRKKDSANEASFSIWFSISVFAMSVVSALTKNVTFHQYYYLPLMLIAILGVEMYPRLTRDSRRIVAFGTLAFGIALLIDGSSSYKRMVRALENDASFFALQSAEEGSYIREQAGEGFILTLSPIFPLEGGNNIYPEFVTSPFAYRTRDYIPEEYRKLYSVVGEKDLDSFMKDKEPCAVYTGWESKHDMGLEDWAQRNGFEPKETLLGKTLWLKP